MAYGGVREQLEDGMVRRYIVVTARLFPTEAQAALFEKTFDCCRWLWNHMLADQQRFYLETGAHFIPTPAKYKNEAPFLKAVDNQALIQEHGRLSQAFRTYFRNPETFGIPKFKRRENGTPSFTACNHVLPSGPTIYTTRNSIRMTKAGAVRAAFSQRPQPWWRLKRITVKRVNGKYNCYLAYECIEKAPAPVMPDPERAVGLHRSASHFYVADDGSMADPPQWYKASREKLAKLQRQMARMEKGSKNYQEALRKYSRLHARIANRRRDYLHQESCRLAGACDAVCVRDEDLSETGQYTGFGAFCQCLQYKLERQGKPLIRVDRCFPAVWTCSVCGLVHQDPEYRRGTWTCGRCGAVHRREVNAARNLKAEGLRQYFRQAESPDSE